MYIGSSAILCRAQPLGAQTQPGQRRGDILHALSTYSDDVLADHVQRKRRYRRIIPSESRQIRHCGWSGLSGSASPFLLQLIKLQISTEWTTSAFSTSEDSTSPSWQGAGRRGSVSADPSPVSEASSSSCLSALSFISLDISRWSRS